MLNGIHKILRKHNLEQAQPTKGFRHGSKTGTGTSPNRVFHRQKRFGSEPVPVVEPCQGFRPKRSAAHLAELELPAMDRLEMNLLLPQWDLLDEQLPYPPPRVTEV